MNNNSLIIKLTLVLVFLLSFLCQHAKLSHTVLDFVEYGNTPINPNFTLPVSDGKIVSLMGVPSRVFSVAGNEIVFEQSVPGAERYVNVLKGDGDTLFAITVFGILDIYLYDPLEGLYLLSSTDLSDPAEDTATIVNPNECFALANGVLIFEARHHDLSWHDQADRSIVDVSNLLSPLLISRIDIIWSEAFRGFYYLNGHYIYIGWDRALYTSDTPTQYPERLYVFGLEQFAFHYIISIADNIYAICSNRQEEFRFGRLDLSDINAAVLSLLHSTELRSGFDICVESGDMICVTGRNSANIWQIEKYLYSNIGDWQLLDTASFAGIWGYTLFPATGGYFLAGFHRSLILDGEFNVQAILNESSSYQFSALILGRYLVLAERDSTEIIGSKIFDLQTEKFLDYFNDGQLVRNTSVHGADKIVFESKSLQVVGLDEGGISRTWSMPIPSETSGIAVCGDLLSLTRLINNQRRIYIYKLTPPGIVLQSTTVLSHTGINTCFYGANHLVVGRSDIGEMYFYRIEQDYSLTYLDELILGGQTLLILDDAILHNGYEGCVVIDTSDPDNPVVTQTTHFPAGFPSQGSYDGHGHYMFNDWRYAFVLDSNFVSLGHLNGYNLCFYEPGCFLIPGSAGVMKAKVDAIVSNDDNLQGSILLQSVRNYPNPFNPDTTIEYTVPKDGKVLVTIYNIKVQKVKELLHKQMLAGKLTVSWDGTDAGGRSLGSGLYFALIEQGNNRQVHKMMLMK